MLSRILSSSLNRMFGWLPDIFRRSISARFHLIILTMLCGFSVIIAISAYSFSRIEEPRVKLERLRKQQIVLYELKSSLLESIVIVDQILFDGENHLTGLVLSLSERIMAKFDRFQSDADQYKLSQDAYLGKEYEPVILRIHGDIYKLIAANNDGNREESIRIRNNSLSHSRRIISDFIKYSEEQRRFNILDLKENIEHRKKELVWLTATTVVIVTAICIFLGNLFGRSVTTPLVRFSKVLGATMTKLANGDYDVEVPGQEHGDEIGSMARAVQVFKDNLIQAKQTEERLNELRNQLTHLSRVNTLGEMATELAHELNQPLAAITNYANGALRRLRSGEWHSEELICATELIAEQALRSGKIIRKMRQMVKNVPPQKSPIDVNLIIREAFIFLPSDANLDGVIIEQELSDSLPYVMADSIQIQQVVLNLALNGLDAMVQHGANSAQLTVRTAMVEKDTIEVTVEDTAFPALADVKERMFDPFFTTKNEGLGMGLTISRTIVEAHGGHLWATSEDGTGTSFHFTLPIATRNRDVAARFIDGSLNEPTPEFS